MIIGIIKQKTKEKITGECKIEDMVIAYNKTTTVICE